jgi:outer membrane protein assembly factor BamB
MYPTPMRALRAGALLLLVAGLCSAGNWDRFRGPNGNGDGGDFTLPDTLTKDNVIWKIEVPGIGHSSPVIWGDKLFVQTSATDGSSRSLVCFNALTGEKLWSEGIKASSVTKGVGGIHNLNSLASSTPATDGERVYTVFWDGKRLIAVAYTFAGKEVWKKDIGTFAGDHGFGGSPVVSDGRIFLNNDQGVKEGDGTPSSLLALDAKSGEVLWKMPRKSFRACSSAPVVNDRPDGKKEVLVSSTAGLAGYDPATGKEIWSYTWSFDANNLRTVASPIVSNGLVIANSGEGGGARSCLAVKLGGTGDVTREKDRQAWVVTRNFPYVPTILAKGEHLFYVSDKGQAGCYEARTGKEVWNKRLSDGFWASPVLVGDKIYAVDARGELYVFKAATTYTPVGKFELGEPVTASPAVANDRLYIRGNHHLFCLGKR